jgi:hypothetical protein
MTLKLSVLLAIGAVTAMSQVSDEPPPTFRSSSLLPASVITGPHYQVADTVPTDEYLYAFSLSSDYGPFTALGRSRLSTRIDEIRAIAALDDVSKSQVFVKAAGGAIVNIGKGAASAVEDPVGTAKGLGAGIKRFGVNLGRAGKRAMTTRGGADTGESAPESAANTIFGVSSAMRRWAQKVGADPYTTNLTLRDALKSIAQVDAAGSIATKIAVPIPAIVGTTATVGDLVWSKDPEELRKFNEGRAKALGASDDVANAFFRNGWFTLTLQTRIVAALHAVSRPGCADYLEAASQVDNEREAHFFVESAEMLQAFHVKRPVGRLLPDSRPIVADVDGKAVLLVPLDYLYSTRPLMDSLEEIAGRARQELGVRQLELQLTGRSSRRAREDARRIGWTITESAPAR